MPHANIWIRRRNWAKWEAMEDKSEWLNTLLENADDTSHWGEKRDIPGVGPSVTVLTEKVPIDLPMERACCLTKSPCRHWQFDDLNGTWTNTISGRVKELE